MIRKVTYNQLDRSRWDDCVLHAANHLIYAESAYLDRMCDHWDALVLDDYSAVMPLPWRKKFGIPYLYQPAFIQQGGIFSRNKLSADIVHAFVRRASQEFRFAEITLNYANELPVTEGIMSETRNNFTLALNGHYRQIADGYSDSFNKNLKRARNLNLSYGRSGDFSAVIKLYMKLYGQRLPYFLHDDYMNFENLCASKTTEQNLFIRTVTSKERILAVALFLISGKRMYNMISCNTDEGRAFEANYLLYDQVIMEFANRNLVLDFEGSDVQGIADFYKRMGPSPEAYTFLKWNRLHPVMKLFKK